MQKKLGNKPDKYDQIRNFILKGEPCLKPEYERMAKMANNIFPILCEQMAHKERVKQIQDLLEINPSRALYLIQETEKIYGRVREHNKAGRKAIMIEFMYESLANARKDKDSKAVERIAHRINMMEGFYEEQGVNITNVYQQLTLQPISVSSDPKTVNIPPIIPADVQ